MFADVAGSTTLYEKLGDRAALRAVDSVVDVLKRAVQAHDGRVVKTTGDGLMAVFPGSDHAASAASEMQSCVSGLAAVDATRLAVRIGLHAGDVLEEHGDCFGDAVNVAARMTAFANAGQIITTCSTVQLLSPLLRNGTREVGALPVKGKREDIRVFEILWRADDQVTLLASKSTQLSTESVLRIECHDRVLVMDSESPQIQIGRDPSNQVVIADMMASRIHGRIERRRGRFYYADLSTNGSYLAQDGEAETVLRREEVLLRGRGAICFGHSASDPGARVLAYALHIRIKDD